jgi:integrase
MGFLPAGHDNPAKKIKMFRETSRDRIPNPAELARILQVIGKMDEPVFQAALLTAFHTGFRHAEVRNLKWCYVDFDAREIVLPDTKAGRPFRQQMTEELEQILRALPRKNRWVFASPLPGRGKDPISRLDKVWKRVLQEANVKNLWLHDVRRLFGSRLVKQTGSLRLVSHALNQTQQSVTERYTRYASDEIREALSVNSKEIERMTRGDTLPAVIQPAPNPVDQMSMFADLIARQVADRLQAITIEAQSNEE